MPITTTVAEIMTRDVETLDPAISVSEAADRLAARNVGAMPVVDANGKLVGMLRDDDLIVSEARVHVPTMLYVLGAVIPLPGQMKHLEDELHKVAGSTVGEVMDDEAPSIGADASIEDLATLMHEHAVTHVPVVDNAGKVVGIVARGDLVRFIARTT
jgi:CBS domain-containing protein